MPDETAETVGDDASDERRLFGERAAGSVAFVASGMGLVRVDVAGDRVGAFTLAERCTATSIAADGGRVTVGTETDVLVRDPSTSAFVAADFGPAAAVGVDGERVLAAGPDGRVERLDVADGDAWEAVGTVEEPRQFDGPLLAASEGVVRVTDRLTALGLDDVRDVARTETGDGRELLAATADGVFAFDDGWTRHLDEPARRLSRTEGTSLVLTDDGKLLVSAGDGHEAIERPPGGDLVDVTQGKCLYAVGADGTVHVAADPAATSDGRGGWRSQSVGVRGVVGLVVLGPGDSA